MKMGEEGCPLRTDDTQSEEERLSKEDCSVADGGAGFVEEWAEGEKGGEVAT